MAATKSEETGSYEIGGWDPNKYATATLAEGGLARAKEENVGNWTPVAPSPFITEITVSDEHVRPNSTLNNPLKNNLTL